MTSEVVNFIKSNMKSYIPLKKRQPYFFLANLFLNRVLTVYVMVDSICMGCKERKPRITKWDILARSGTRTLEPWFSSLVPNPLGHPIWYTNGNLKLIQYNTGVHCVIYSYIVPCQRVFSFCRVFSIVVIWNGCHFAVWQWYWSNSKIFRPFVFHLIREIPPPQQKNGVVLHPFSNCIVFSV